jgi:hypothetical protein
LCFFIFSIIFSLFYGYSFSTILGKYVLTASNAINGFVLIFLIIDYFLIMLSEKEKIKYGKIRKLRPLFSLIIGIVIGLILFIIIGKDVLGLLSEIFSGFLHPFGTGRIGLTVAENKQPYLLDWIGETGRLFFWMFFIGVIIAGIEISKLLGSRKRRSLFCGAWVIMVSGILLSRISSDSLLNGENFLSKFVYFGGLFLFIFIAGWIYLKERVNISFNLILIGSWLFIMIISGRGAIRLLFAITPFACFMAGFAAVNVFNYAKKTRDGFFRILFWSLFVLIIIFSLFSFYSFIVSSKEQAQFTGPSASNQWQRAMQWVRENTIQNAIFVHWWDYGYWVQYLGERATITDGGHANGFWDHLIGRYVLTTTKPETALSFIKAHKASYLLIDPTDIGKYPAYSSIGSGPQKEDRHAWIPTLSSDANQIRETAQGEIRIYQTGFLIEDDIIYKENNTEVFLPAE